MGGGRTAIAMRGTSKSGKNPTKCTPYIQPSLAVPKILSFFLTEPLTGRKLIR
jgi:hypothetical protein